MLLDKTTAGGILKGLCGTANFPADHSGNCWMGLFTAAPGNSPTAASIANIELSGKGYRRTNISAVMNQSYKSYALSEAAVTAHDRRIGNADQIAFHEAINESDPDAATGGDWATVTHFGLFSSETATTPFAWGALDSAVTVTTHKVFLFRDGHFEIYMDTEET